MVFNERPSVLLRTVKSVLERSPPERLQRILLVDDKSDNLLDSEVCTNSFTPPVNYVISLFQ